MTDKLKSRSLSKSQSHRSVGHTFIDKTSKVWYSSDLLLTWCGPLSMTKLSLDAGIPSYARDG